MYKKVLFNVTVLLTLSMSMLSEMAWADADNVKDSTLYCSFNLYGKERKIPCDWGKTIFILFTGKTCNHKVQTFTSPGSGDIITYYTVGDDMYVEYNRCGNCKKDFVDVTKVKLPSVISKELASIAGKQQTKASIIKSIDLNLTFFQWLNGIFVKSKVIKRDEDTYFLLCELDTLVKNSRFDDINKIINAFINDLGEIRFIQE